MNRNKEICNAFNAQAKEYEQAAKVQLEVGNRLIERLSYLKIEPKFILDLGCGTGFFTAKLKQLYPKAQIVGFDLACAMLKEAKRKQGWRRKWPLVNGEMTSMPFPTGLFDLVFANQVLHWADSFPVVMRELNRVMNVDGCLMFSTLGPDTFQELRKAWTPANQYAHTNEFADMHDLGDSLLNERFNDPVVDMEMLTVHYKTLPELVRSLKVQGVRNINPSRNQGLTGKHAWQQFEEAFQGLRTQDAKFPLTYEVVYGHAWKGQERRMNQGSETFIPVERLRRSRS